jgi:hypothetical protein
LADLSIPPEHWKHIRVFVTLFYCMKQFYL